MKIDTAGIDKAIARELAGLVNKVEDEVYATMQTEGRDLVEDIRDLQHPDVTGETDAAVTLTQGRDGDRMYVNIYPGPRGDRNAYGRYGKLEFATPGRAAWFWSAYYASRSSFRSAINRAINRAVSKAARRVAGR